MYKQLLAGLAGLAILAAASVAYANQAKGFITKLDPQSQIVTLDNGTPYHADKSVTLNNLKVGDHVTIDFVVQGGLNKATSIISSSD